MASSREQAAFQRMVGVLSHHAKRGEDISPKDVQRDVAQFEGINVNVHGVDARQARMLTTIAISKTLAPNPAIFDKITNGLLDDDLRTDVSDAFWWADDPAVVGPPRYGIIGRVAAKGIGIAKEAFLASIILVGGFMDATGGAQFEELLDE